MFYLETKNKSKDSNLDGKNNESNPQFDLPTDEELNALFDNSDNIDFQAVFSNTLNADSKAQKIDELRPSINKIAESKENNLKKTSEKIKENNHPLQPWYILDEETKFHMATDKWDREMIARMIDLYPESKVSYDEIICQQIAKILKEEFPYTTIDFFNSPNYSYKHFCQIDSKFKYYSDKSHKVENLCTREENIYGKHMTQKMMEKICKWTEEKNVIFKEIAIRIKSKPEFNISLSSTELKNIYNKFEENVDLAKKKVLQMRNSNVNRSNFASNITNDNLDLNNNSSNISIEKKKSENL